MVADTWNDMGIIMGNPEEVQMPADDACEPDENTPVVGPPLGQEVVVPEERLPTVLKLPKPLPPPAK